MQRSVRARLTVGLTAVALATSGVGLAAPAGAAGVRGDRAATASRASTTVDTGTLGAITRIVGAQDLWAAGYTGAGVDVAVIDTGISPVPGLDQGNEVDGIDLSFDSQDPEVAGLDGYGHGTHMAGIIAGRDPGPGPLTDPNRFVGVAPGSRVVDVKVGAADGATDVSQVIAGIDWVVDHRAADGLNIRVINLSFGTDSLQPYLTDPLAYAVDRAWRAGIVVVVAAGNDGLATTSLANPATNPLILAVGASESNGTIATSDDTVPAFATHGNVLRPVDVIAPGTHVLSLRVPGSFVDLANPLAAEGERFIRGSGTSQATAVVSGLAALLIERFPNATPDQVKAYLMGTARPIGLLSGLRLPILGNPVNAYWAGRGVVDGAPAVRQASLARSTQLQIPATGLGSLDAARGTVRVAFDGVAVVGEIDVLGVAPGSTTEPFANRWTANRWTGNRWTANRWTGNRWTANRWTGNRWTANRWTGSQWSSGTWS